MQNSILEQQKEICESIIDGYETIIATDAPAFETLEKAKKDSLGNCIMENIHDFERSQRLQNEIKLYYLSREYALFLKSFERNLYSKKILHKVKLDITSGRKYQYFDTLGLDVNSNFEEDLRAFFANYKIAAKKIKELESLIELSQKNRGIHL